MGDLNETGKAGQTELESVFEENKNRILGLMSAKKYIHARDEFMSLNEVDAAEVFEEAESELGIEMAVILFRMLPKDAAAEVFSRLDTDDQLAIVDKITDRELGSIMEEMDFDDMIDALEELPANVVDKVLEKSTGEERKLINTFLNYPENSAGSLMTPDYITLKKGWTVGQALDHIKEVGMDSETVYTCYVKDWGRKLLGIVSLRSLVTHERDVPISEFMIEDIVYVGVYEDQEKVSESFTRYGFLAMPVVDGEHRLVGIITVDDILDVIEEETTEDIERMGGVIGADDREYLDTSVFRHYRNRFPWLFLLMCSAMVTTYVISRYEVTLSEVASLASYMTLLMGTGGNSGSQASTLVIRGLALGEIELKDALRVLWKELRVSFLLGASLSGINFCKIYFIDQHAGGNALYIALTACVAQLLVVCLAKCIGGMLPLLAKRIGIDPALMAAPFISTLTDTFACLVYFTFATMVFVGLRAV
ncbi:MAG: magnesium transporter [Clostridiales Family XIII bacterium]|jgi:magnesium transporter|nr:magnesium transporter [Clostridiales Family XIII bacterium]